MGFPDRIGCSLSPGFHSHSESLHQRERVQDEVRDEWVLHSYVTVSPKGRPKVRSDPGLEAFDHRFPWSLTASCSVRVSFTISTLE